jgi:outer membrane scaffolding protein for murein synthesis (MipA/OmpV family)
MKTVIRLLLCTLPCAAWAAGPSAPLVPLPTVPDFTRGGGWGLALGLGVEYENAYDGSDERELELDPAGALQWRSGNHLFFWEGYALGWRGLPSPGWLLQTGLRYEGGLEPDDSEDGRLEGIAERDSHPAAFLEVRRELGDDWRNWAGAFMLGGESEFGWLGLLAAGHRFGERRDGMGSEVYAFGSFGNSAFFNKDFGVDAVDAAASGLRETDLSGGFRSLGVTWVHRRELGDRLQLVVEAGFEWYSPEIHDSPIARTDYEFELGLSLLWTF